jgi:hypothetical protein
MREVKAGAATKPLALDIPAQWWKGRDIFSPSTPLGLSSWRQI